MTEETTRQTDRRTQKLTLRDTENSVQMLIEQADDSSGVIDEVHCTHFFQVPLCVS